MPPTASSGVKNGIVRHSLPLPEDDVVEVAGVRVTSLTRTVLDLASTGTFLQAVVVADARSTVDRFGRRPPWLLAKNSRQLDPRPATEDPRTNQGRLGFAETRAETPIESMSRVTMRAIGVPHPLLQVAHYD